MFKNLKKLQNYLQGSQYLLNSTTVSLTIVSHLFHIAKNNKHRHLYTHI